MDTTKLSKEEINIIKKLSTQYNLVASNINEYSKQLKEVQDKITNETDILESLRLVEAELMQGLQEKYNEVPTQMELINLINN